MEAENRRLKATTTTLRSNKSALPAEKPAQSQSKASSEVYANSPIVDVSKIYTAEDTMYSKFLNTVERLRKVTAMTVQQPTSTVKNPFHKKPKVASRHEVDKAIELLSRYNEDFAFFQDQMEPLVILLRQQVRFDFDTRLSVTFFYNFYYKFILLLLSA